VVYPTRRQRSRRHALARSWSDPTEGQKDHVSKKRKRNGRTRVTERSIERVPSTTPAFGSMVNVFAELVRHAESFEDAAARARAELRDRALRLAEMSCGHDLIRVVSSVRVAMVMAQMSRDVDLPASALELLALVLAYRDQNPTFVVRAEPPASFMPPVILKAAHEALSYGAVMSLLAAPPSDPHSALVFYSVQREIHLRNAAYPEMLLDTLRGIFADFSTENDCRTVLGFTGRQAIDIMEAARQSAPRQMLARFERMEQARDQSLPHLEQWQPDDPAAEPPEELRRAMQFVFDALQALTTDIAEVAVLDPGALAAATGHDLATVEAVLDTFTLGQLPDIDEVIDRFFNGDNPLRTAPIVRDQNGRRMLVHDALALPAVREVLEHRLNAANRFSTYQQARGTYVENAALDLLVDALPGATPYRSFRYFVPDPNAASPQTRPEEFTKRVEADGLILIDDVAIIVEVKSVSLTAEARSGVVQKLYDKLREIITKAADQADRLRQRILADGRIRLDDGAWIDVSGVREIHTVAVGLEDLSGITTATAMLVDAGVLKQDHIPWTVSLHDLRIICELVERPAELLLYLRRRTEPLVVTRRYRAVDELDLYMHFLERGLYVEPDPRVIAANTPWADPPTPAEVRRFERQRPELVLDRTKALDAWYASRLDPNAPAANKPRLNAHQDILTLIDMIAADGSPGWLPTTAMLLEVNTSLQRAFARQAADLAKLVRRDGNHHSITHLVHETTGKSMLLVWACHGRNETAETAVGYLLPYLQAKKHQTGAYRATCMVFDPTGTRLLRLLYDNRPAGPNPALDEAAKRLRPLAEMKRMAPHRARHTRKRKRRRSR